MVFKDDRHPKRPSRRARKSNGARRLPVLGIAAALAAMLYAAGSDSMARDFSAALSRLTAAVVQPAGGHAKGAATATVGIRN